MKKRRVVIFLLIVSLIAWFILLFYDYQYLYGADDSFKYILLRWTIQLTILGSIIFLFSNRWIKTLLVVFTIAGIFYNQEYRPLRPTALNSFLENNQENYYSIIENSAIFEGLREIIIINDDSYTTNENLILSESQNLELNKIVSKLRDIPISRVYIENNNCLFFHGPIENACAMIYYKTGKYYSFQKYDESHHIQINKHWSYYGNILVK